MLTDAEPLIALFDAGDPYHRSCLNVLHTLPKGPLSTTWPCFTEAMYLLNGLGRYRYQERLWKMRREQKLILLDITADELDRMDILMAQYRNVPMDMADASLVAVAESRNLRRLFTLDSDFYIYRLSDGSVLDITP